MKACPQCHIRYPAEATYCFLDGASLADIQDPLIGTTIGGRYLVEGVIGEGGMATVYRATHKLVDRPCAVKVMNPAMASDQRVRERFRREARSAQSLAHPNVIEIFDQGETADGTPYIVMELLSGKTLADLVANGPLPPVRALPLLIQVTRGIARAHDLGIVHRDLKPENIFVSVRPDGSEAVKILDFGIARSRGDSRLTNAGELFGTPQYLAPERIVSGEAGPSVDLYALGVIFFEVLTGRLPFEAKDPTSFLLMHMKDTPPRVRDLRPGIPPALDALVAQLLEKLPKARPVDARRIENDLIAIAKTLGVSAPTEPEVDPASSSRPEARTLPPVGVQQWRKRLEVFEQMLARADGAAAGRDLRGTLDGVREHVRELAEARQTSSLEQHKLEEIDARGREGRQRLGFAVDALGVDASRARDEVRAARAEIERISPDVRAAAAAFAAAQSEVVMWEGRCGAQEPHPNLAAAYRRAAEIVDAWIEVRGRERVAQETAEERERVVADLDYQIGALRAAMKASEQGIDKDREATEARLVALSARGEHLEGELLRLATRFCEPLRTRAELAPFFQELESDASASR